MSNSSIDISSLPSRRPSETSLSLLSSTQSTPPTTYFAQPYIVNDVARLITPFLEISDYKAYSAAMEPRMSESVFFHLKGEELFLINYKEEDRSTISGYSSQARGKNDFYPKTDCTEWMNEVYNPLILDFKKTDNSFSCPTTRYFLESFPTAIERLGPESNYILVAMEKKAIIVDRRRHFIVQTFPYQFDSVEYDPKSNRIKGITNQGDKVTLAPTLSGPVHPESPKSRWQKFCNVVFQIKEIVKGVFFDSFELVMEHSGELIEDWRSAKGLREHSMFVISIPIDLMIVGIVYLPLSTFKFLQELSYELTRYRKGI